MKTIELMLRSHPRSDAGLVTDYAETLKALSTCAEICTACADACLGEGEHVEKLRHCITTDLACADVCHATARTLSRLTEPPHAVIEALLHACVVACQACADECEEHGGEHDHCRLCAETCRYCQERCNAMLGTLSSAGVRSDVRTGEDSPPLAR